MSRRNSSIELLKLISLFILCFSHCLMSTGIIFDNATNNYVVLIGTILRCFGQIGNVIFIVCSSFFLTDSSKIKNNKIIGYILDSFVISILFLIVFLAIDINMSMKDVIKSFFPITFQNNWFIGCYIMLYIIHPFLNSIIKNISQKELLRINLFLLFLYSVIQFLLPGKFYFNNLIGFIEIYFIVSYFKLYLPEFKKNIKINICFFLVAVICNICLIIITNILGLKINIFSNKLLMWNNNIANPFYIIIGITIFNIISNRSFYNKYINYLSSCSLLFYMIHENLLFRNYIRPIFFENTIIDYMIPTCLFITCVIFIISMIISIIYKNSIQKLILIISDYISIKFSIIYKKVELKILSIK